MLSRRALSEGEIRFRLTEKGFPEDQTVAALAKLRELGLVDDTALCANLARSYRDVRRLGELVGELVKEMTGARIGA